MEPRNNPFKLPAFVLIALGGLVMLWFGIEGGPALLTLAGTAVVVLAVVGLVPVLRGRNPWYVRSPLDEPRD